MDNIQEPTNFPNGLTSYGLPVIGAGRVPVTNGQYYFVDGTNGNDGINGNSLAQPLKTIAAAIARAAVNDVILVMPGTYTESVTCSVAGVRIIGLASATNAVKWLAATDAVCLTISAANVEVAGFRFTAPVRSAGSPAAILLSNASYAHIHGNRFQGATGSYYAIYSPVCNSDNVIIEGNDFEYLNTATEGSAIYCLEAGGLSYSDWIISGNKFSSCIRAIYLNGRVCLISGNHIAQAGITSAGAVGTNVTTTKITLSGVSGTNSGANQVHGNYLGGTYSIAGGYITGASGDDWSGNFVIAGATTALPA